MLAFPRRLSARLSTAALGSALLAICCLMEVCVPVNGDYNVEVKIFSYDNPSGRCLGCPERSSDGSVSCCDDFRHFDSCDGDRRCDSYFNFCLRPFGMTGGDCTHFIGKQSMTNTDDVCTDFSMSSEVLGLENPLTLSGLTTSYNSFIGVQLYIHVRDEDTGGKSSRYGARAPDEDVDFFVINHNLAVGESTQRQTFNGRANFVTMDLNITVFCVENFQEPDCTQCVTGFTGPDCQTSIDDCEAKAQNCSGRGQCVDGVDSFNCSCDPGFTGDTCQTNIDDCVEAQNCSERGQCVDGVDTFTCECSPGYSGTVCDIEIEDAIEDSGAVPSGNIGGVIGGVVGVLIILILISVILIVFAIIVLRHKKSQRKGTQGVKSKSHERHREVLPGDNPVYELEEGEGHKYMNVNSMGRTESTVPLQANEEEREVDNVIYGFEDEDVGGNEAANCYEIPSNSLQHNVPCHEFDNPVYEIGNGEGIDTTYSLLSDPSAELYDTVTDQELKQ